MGQRARKVSQVIQEELSAQLQRDFPLKYGLLNVNRVETTQDLGLARVYYGFLGNEEQENDVAQYLENHSADLQQCVARALRHMRRIPKLRFVRDRGTEHSLEIQQRIDDLKQRGEL